MLLLLNIAVASAWPPRPSGHCVYPGKCTPPDTKFSRVLPTPPRQQWNLAGGFCGALSFQTSHLAFGAWISQDLVRKANTHGAGHCESGEGCEVGALNLNETAFNLKLNYDEWDYNSPKPQSPRYLKWMKEHLVRGEPVIWFVMCKGDDVCPYPNACPNGASFGHIEPVYGVFSDEPLTTEDVTPSDWVVHGSDQDLLPYYRRMSNLVDTTKMEGNCSEAQPGFGKNEMFPCINDQTDVGISITGIRGSGSIPVSLAVDSAEEPNIREGQRPEKLGATVTVSGLTKGTKYILYRYDGTESLPTDPSVHKGYSASHAFMAAGDTFTFEDKILSSSAVYFRAFPSSS